MNKLSAILIVSLIVALSPVRAEDLNAGKKTLIDELLTVSGAAKMGEMMSGAFVAQLTNAMKSTKPDIEPRAFEILEEEVNSLISEELFEKNALNEILYPIYHKHLTSDDMEELIAFYKTPVGRKVIETMPLIFQESSQAGQIWGASLGPEIQKRITTRLEEEGISLQ